MRRPVLLLAALLVSGCYRLRIDESFWLRARPGPAADSAALAAALPGRYALAPIAIPVGEGVELRGVVASRPDAVATVLFFGSDDFVVASHGPATLRALGASSAVNVVLVDYRGTGTSGGAPTLAGLKADGLAVYDWVAARPDMAAGGLIVHGHSVGSFVAAHVAESRPADGLVLQSSATTPTEWMRGFFRPSRFKWWARPAYPFIRVSLDPALAAEDNVARVRRFRGPLLVLVGAADTKTVPAMSRALHAAASTPDEVKRLAVLPGAGHEDVLQHPDLPALYRDFVEIVRRGSSKRPPS